MHSDLSIHLARALADDRVRRAPVDLFPGPGPLRRLADGLRRRRGSRGPGRARYLGHEHPGHRLPDRRARA
jgi:hypothetical protein